MEIPYPAFRCSPIQFTVAQPNPHLDPDIFGMRNFETKAIRDQRVDA
jgi:hypothetical protein